MPTTRGFVRSIEIGRAGQVSVTLIQQDGSAATFVINDLDADPERFNERLSMLGLARDAMNRAEPVEIEHTPSDGGGNQIERIRRVTRDNLAPITSGTEMILGIVVDLLLHSENGTTTNGEKSDSARVTVLASNSTVEQLVLDMQVPERLVAAQQYETIREGHATGATLTFLATLDAETKLKRIFAVGIGGNNGRNQQQGTLVDGFVESISLIPPPAAAGMLGTFAHVRMTTAPPFTGAGNTVGLALFTPKLIDLLAPQHSTVYELFEAGLRDTLRMRVQMVPLGGRDANSDSTTLLNRTIDSAGNSERTMGGGATGGTGSGSTGGTGSGAGSGTGGSTTGGSTSGSGSNTAGGSTSGSGSNTAGGSTGSGSTGGGSTAVGGTGATLGSTATAAGATAAAVVEFQWATAAELLAPIASASRPVWISIERDTLVHGPDAAQCIKGVPSSDLTVQTLRDLRIPFPAVWRGLGCFNHGVYRFQIQVPTEFRLLLDGEPLCLHDSETAGAKLAHACIEGDHEVTIELDRWTCDSVFLMDVYRIR